MYMAAAYEQVMDTQARFLYMLLYPLAFLGYSPTADWLRMFEAAVQAKMAALSPQDLCYILTSFAMCKHQPERPLMHALVAAGHSLRAQFSDEQLAWFATSLLALKYSGSKDLIISSPQSFMSEIVRRNREAAAGKRPQAPVQKAFSAWEKLVEAMVKAGGPIAAS